MKASSINELKQELSNLPSAQLLDICLKLARFKKENKELLSFLLFEADDEPGYINNVKMEIDEQFEKVNQENLYFAKKSIRKILRIANKHIRYAGSKTVEIELLTHFCAVLNGSGIPYAKSTALVNLYQSQLKKIKKAIETLHEDLQYDYLKELGGLEL